MNTDGKWVVTFTLLAWLCLAVTLAGPVREVSALALAATVWILTALALVACWKITAIKIWALHVDLRWLIMLHLTRFIAGAYFLVLCGRGELPCAFATRAGWGDIIVAVFALAVLVAMRAAFAKALLLVWNAVGLLDIIFVVFSALQFGSREWHSMYALRELPLSLLPTFLVPLIIASHVLIFVLAGATAKCEVKNCRWCPAWYSPIANRQLARGMGGEGFEPPTLSV